MKLLTVIVNFRTPLMSIDAVRAALVDVDEIGDAAVVVVDNDSGDGSFEKMTQAAREVASPRLEIVRSDRNGGFGYGNNFAIRRALASGDPPEYVYLLNSDAFPEPGAIRALVRYLDEHPRVGIAGSHIHGPDGTPHETAFRFPSLASEFENSIRLGVVSKLFADRVVAMPMPESTTEVDWLAGASMMIRRRVLEEVGLFDETFFLYFEETDLCLRAKRAGWPTVYVRESAVTHIGHASTGMKDTSRPMPTYWFDSRKYFLEKTYGRGYLWASNAARIGGLALFRARQRIQSKSDADPPRFLRDFVKHTFGFAAERRR